jgi:glycine/D-amino acid oxidase-like deaminating enzyme
MEVEVPLSTPDASDVSALKQQGRKRIRLPRVAIVGAVFVGSTTAYALLISGTAAEIVLIDQDRRPAEGRPCHFARRASGIDLVQLGAPINGARRSIPLPSRHR